MDADGCCAVGALCDAVLTDWIGRLRTAAAAATFGIDVGFDVSTGSEDGDEAL